MIPGNSAHNLRRLALLETNYADLSFLFTLDTGQPTCPHLGRDALAVFETEHQTPYRFALHVADVGHTLVLGATGTGKSFLLNFLITQAQQYDPFTVIFDLGHSYRSLATLLQGGYVEVNLRQCQVAINPFALEPTPEHRHFQHALVKVLLEGRDEYRLSDAEDRELYEAIENLDVLDRGQRRLFTLRNLLPRPLATRLARWTEGGQYGALFDHVDDTFTFQTLQVVDLQAMAAYPELLEPLIFYVLHRVTARVQAPADAARLKLCIFDEAWRFIQHERIRAYVHEALKTWRKHQAAMLLATQTIEDFASTDLLRTIVESCPTKLLLANPAFDHTTYRGVLHLNETELNLVRTLMPRRQFFMKRPGLAKVLTLAVEADPSDDTTAAGSTGHSLQPDDSERLASRFITQ
jgi:type IV secretion system protein VirB4